MPRTCSRIVPALLACLLAAPAWAARPPRAPASKARPAKEAPRAEKPAREAPRADKPATAPVRPPLAVPDAWPGVADYAPVAAGVAAAGAAAADPARALKLAEAALAGASGRSAELARVIRGLALYRLGRYAEAADTLGAVDREPIAVDDLVTFFQAESLFHAGDYADAERILRDYDKTYPESVWRHRAAFRLADCQLARDFHAGAIATLRRLQTDYPEYPHQAALRFAIAQAEVKRGRIDAAAAELRRLLKEVPGDPLVVAAQRMLAGLEAQGAKPDKVDADTKYAQAVDLRRRRYYEPALKAFQALATDPGADAPLRRRARRQAARTLFDMERFDEALAAFTALAADAPDAGQRREELRWKAHCLERLGRLDDAAEALTAARGGAAPTPAQLYELAWLYLNGAAYQKAADAFVKVAKAGGRWEQSTRWWRAWMAYRLGDYDTAIEAFKRLQATSHDRPDQYAYWLARALARKGEIEAAVDTYRGLLGSAPLSYYAYQARERLRELGRPVEEDAAPVAAATPPDEPKEEGGGTGCEADDEEHAGCEAKAADDDDAARKPVVAAKAPESKAPEPEVAAKAAEPKADPDPPEPAAAPEAPSPDSLSALAAGWGALFPDLVAAHELDLIGERTLAASRLRAVSDELDAFREARAARRDPARWRFRARPYLERGEGEGHGEWGRSLDDPPAEGEPRRGPTLAKGLPGEFYRHFSAALVEVGDFFYARRHRVDRTPLHGPPEAGPENARWAQRFPRAYRAIVEEQAAHYGLDPYFLWALMTQESTYDALAVSPVGARGLMQVMPYTGSLIADRMAWRNFGPALLFEPRVVIEMSAWYFHQLLTKFNGQLPLAIAGYNAGPHRVAAWLQRKGHLPMDEFIEEIPYTEARGYTKKVLYYLALYRRIYERSPELRVSQVIDPAFKNNINF